MKVLIVSDSHFNLINNKIFEKEKPDFAIHCGDSQLDFNHPDLKNYDIRVRGNCDFDKSFELEKNFDIDKTNFFVVHGHLHGVNYSNEELLNINNDTKVIIHGHTHVVKCEVEDGVLILNPGSVTQSRCMFNESYMILDLADMKVYLKDAKNYQLIKTFNI